MRDRLWIFAGLAVFLVLITFPVWYNKAAGTTSRGPELKLPAGEKTCVAATAYMRASHMNLLLEWRDQVVRRGSRTWTAPDGKSYEMSLTGTCLKCHSEKEQFCDRCHNYAGVTPYCWECHVDPQIIRKGALNARR